MDKEQKNLVATFTETFPGVVMVEDAMRLALRLHKQVNDASSEIESLRAEVAYLKTPCPRCDYEEPND